MPKIFDGALESVAFIEDEIKDYSDLDYAIFKFVLAFCWDEMEYAKYWSKKMKSLREKKLTEEEIARCLIPGVIKALTSIIEQEDLLRWGDEAPVPEEKENA